MRTVIISIIILFAFPLFAQDLNSVKQQHLKQALEEIQKQNREILDYQQKQYWKEFHQEMQDRTDAHNRRMESIRNLYQSDADSDSDSDGDSD